MLPDPESLSLAAALAMDATAVCVAWAIGHGRGAARALFALPVAFGAAQAGMSAAGLVGGTAAHEYAPGVLNVIAVVVLAALGLRMLWPRKDGGEESTVKRELTLFVVLGLAFATSVDALGAGVGLAALTPEPWVAVGWIGIVTMVLSLVALSLGSRLGQKTGQWGERVGGLVLIGLAGHLAFAG